MLISFFLPIYPLSIVELTKTIEGISHKIEIVIPTKSLPWV